MKFRRALAVGTMSLTLAACGGGGGPAGSTGGEQVSGSYVMAPTAAEIERSTGAVRSGATAAHDRGATGADLDAGTLAVHPGSRNRNIVAVLDDGLADPRDGAFAGRIVAPYDFIDGDRDVASGFDGSRGDHGTIVSHVLAAAGDGEGVLGVAPQARVMPLRISDETGFRFRYDAVLDYARENRAAVLNQSWGTPGHMFGASADDIAFYDAALPAIGRAVAAGMVFVFAAGNESLDDPSLEGGLPYFHPSLEDHWIVAVALDASDDRLAAFSNRCGAARDWCLAAPGVNVGTVDGRGQTIEAHGTSLAVPVVSGAVAVLLQLFPYLSAAEVVDILFATADDLGQPGVDAEYGHGRLNLERATRPVGTMTLAQGPAVTDGGPDATASFLQASPAFGDGLAHGFAGRRLAVFDRFGRAFTVDLAAFAAKAGEGAEPLGSPHPFLGLAGATASLDQVGPMRIATAAGLGSLGAEGTVHLADDRLRLSAGLLYEDDAALGMRGAGAFALGDTLTPFVGAALEMPMSGKVSLFGEASFGRSFGAAQGFVAGIDLTATALRAGITAELAGGTLRVAAGQPLRAGGTLRLDLPTGRDAEGRVERSPVSIPLSPSSRQFDVTLGWAGPLAFGALELGAVLRLDPGHAPGAPDGGAAAQWRLPF